MRLSDSGSLGRVDVELMPIIGRGELDRGADQRAQFRFGRIEWSGPKSAAITVSGCAGGRQRLSAYRY